MIMRPHHALAAFTLAGASFSGCTPLVEIDAPDIEVTQPNLQFPAAPAGATSGTTVKGSFVLRNARLGASSSPDAGSYKKIKRLDLTRLVFKTNTGVVDFAFLDHLTVEATNAACYSAPTADRPVVQVLDYEVSHQPEIGAELPIPLSPPVDMLPLWGRTSLCVTVEATGNPPKVDWSIDVVFSLSIKINQ